VLGAPSFSEFKLIRADLHVESIRTPTIQWSSASGELAQGVPRSSGAARIWLHNRVKRPRNRRSPRIRALGARHRSRNGTVKMDSVTRAAEAEKLTRSTATLAMDRADAVARANITARSFARSQVTFTGSTRSGAAVAAALGGRTGRRLEVQFRRHRSTSISTDRRVLERKPLPVPAG